MKSRFRTLLTAFLGAMSVAALSVALAACGDPEEPEKPSSGETAYYLSTQSSDWATHTKESDVPAGLLFEKRDDLYTLTAVLEEGEAFTVNAVGSDVRYGFDKVYSSRSELAEGENGVISVAKTGTFVLTLDVTGGADITYTYTSSAAQTATRTKVEITEKNESMTVGQRFTFVAKVTYSDGSDDSNVTWSSSSSDILAIDARTGAAQARAQGTAIVTATAGNLKDEAVVTVGPTIRVQSVTLSEDELLLDVGETETLTATVLPENASIKDVIWASSNPDIVSVNEGTITAKSVGTAQITVTTTNAGRTAVCTVTVRQPVTSVLATESLRVVAEGNEKKISVTVLPANATFNTYTYEVTQGADCVQVQEDETPNTLLVRGLKQGTAKVTITSDDNPEAKAVCTVTVEAKGTVVPDLSATELELNIGTSANLTAMLDGESISTVAWAAKDNNVSVTTPNEATTAISADRFGTTTVTATINGSYTVDCTVRVISSYFYLTGYNGSWDLASEEEAAAQGILMSLVDRGIYTVTRHFDKNANLQILNADLDTNWGRAIRANRYTADPDTASFINISSDGMNAVIKTAGVYTVKLDLTGTLPSWTVILKSVDVETVAIGTSSAGLPTTIEEGGQDTTILLATITPKNATYTREDVEWWADPLYSGWLDLEPLETNPLQCTVILAKTEGTDVVTIRVYCSVGGVEAWFEIGVVPMGAFKAPVTEVNFAKPLYTVNVNSGYGWSTTVEATVNDNATIKSIIYTSEDEGVTVDAVTGKVTASHFGTFTIKATASDDSSKSSTTQVLFYSPYFYLVGMVNGVDKWNTDNSAELPFTQEINNQYARWEIKSITFRAADAFKVIYSDIPAAQWNDLALTSDHLNRAGSPQCVYADDYGIGLAESGVYKITVDLTKPMPSITVTKTGSVAADMSEKGVTVYLYPAGDFYKDEETYFTRIAGRIKPEEGTYEITGTFEFDLEEETEWQQIQFAVELNNSGSKIWYGPTYSATTLTFSGTAYGNDTSAGVQDKWNKGDGGVLWYQGKFQKKSFTFTFTFTAEGILQSVKIDG